MEGTAKQKRLVILGGGESGIGAAVLGKVKGMDVFLSDCGKIAPRYLEPTILISILYIVGIVAALNIWKNPHDKGKWRK